MFISYWGMESYPLDIHAPLKAVSPCIDGRIVWSHAAFVDAGDDSASHQEVAGAVPTGHGPTEHPSHGFAKEKVPSPVVTLEDGKQNKCVWVFKNEPINQFVR